MAAEGEQLFCRPSDVIGKRWTVPFSLSTQGYRGASSMHGPVSIGCQVVVPPETELGVSRGASPAKRYGNEVKPPSVLRGGQAECARGGEEKKKEGMCGARNTDEIMGNRRAEYGTRVAEQLDPREASLIRGDVN
ncbi:uncharacterized protein LOC114255312 isoform X2 [Monomorium pharaonis]|uniref:uncharacterized protein LOC114255312 isoform X2 n=1 Tax=Monomorium pharaonis TaxID=307658 RepID=UPI0017461ED3|nr:uncharacterized protein LOC114255312 isoform X2 [Monomorium pharaonis]